MFKSINSIPGYEEYTDYELDINGTLRKGYKIFKWSLTNGYLQFNLYVNGVKKKILQHRAIALLFIPNPRCCEFVDHKNGIRYDNRVENLRWCTNAENQYNRKIQNTNTSGFKNISKVCLNGYFYWRIQIKSNGKRFHKTFNCEPDDTEVPAEVILFRNEMLQELHGEFARIT